MPRLTAFIVLVAASVFGLLGCPANNGTNPPTDSFYYPVAAAIDPAGDWLYVVSADFDLSYNAGTVIAVNLQHVRALIGAQPPAGCSPDTTPTAEQDTAAGYPVFDCDVRGSADTSGLINHSFTRLVNPFALDATMAAYPARNGHPASKRLYVLVSGDGTVTWFNVGADGSLDCGPPGTNNVCADDHRVGFDPAQSLSQVDTLPPEPSALSVDPNGGWITVVSQETDPTIPHAVVLRDTAFDVGPTAGHVQLVNTVLNLAPGLSALALVPRPANSNARSTWLSVSETDPSFTILQAYGGNPAVSDARPLLYLDAQAPVFGLNTGANNRSVAIDPRPDHTRAFVASRSPEALLVVDIHSITYPMVTDVIPVAPGPSRVLPVYDASTQHTTVYVVSYDARKIYVVDPDNHVVTDEIYTNRGPHQPVLDPTMPLLYVLDFLDSTVEVIDLRPTLNGRPNPRFHHRVLTIGYPVPPEVTL